MCRCGRKERRGSTTGRRLSAARPRGSCQSAMLWAGLISALTSAPSLPHYASAVFLTFTDAADVTAPPAPATAFPPSPTKSLRHRPSALHRLPSAETATQRLTAALRRRHGRARLQAEAQLPPAPHPLQRSPHTAQALLQPDHPLLEHHTRETTPAQAPLLQGQPRPRSASPTSCRASSKVEEVTTQWRWRTGFDPEVQEELSFGFPSSSWSVRPLQSGVQLPAIWRSQATRPRRRYPTPPPVGPSTSRLRQVPRTQTQLSSSAVAVQAAMSVQVPQSGPCAYAYSSPWVRETGREASVQLTGCESSGCE